MTAGKNQKKIWKCLNSLISDKSYKSCEEVVFDDGRCSDPVMLCEKFNSFFVDSIILLNGNIPHHDYMSQLTRYNEENVRLKFRPTNIEEVTKTLRFLSKKINKSEICNSMVWLDSAEYYGYFLTRIINDSMQTGYFPTLWKIATVVPIPKIKNSNKAADYRGINILPINEKVCEIIVKNQLVEFVESNRILSQHQSAFRAKHSCESTINYFINDLKFSMEDGQFVVAVFLDLKRAFETVDRIQMLQKLWDIGVRNTELKWFTSYLDMDILFSLLMTPY